MADVELRKLASDGDSLNAPIPAGSVASWLEESEGKVVEKARLSDGRVVTVNDAMSSIRFDGTTIAKSGDAYAVNEIPTSKVTGLDGKLAAKLEQSDISGLQTVEQVNGLIAEKMVSVVRFKGIKNAVSDLDASVSEAGDLWLVKSDGGKGSNLFKEYVCVEEPGSGGTKTKKFELIGSTDSDTFSSLNSDMTELKETLSGYSSSSKVKTAVDAKQDRITSGSPLPAGMVSGLATVATTGSYNSLSERPEIPAAQVQVDWSLTSGVASILHKPNVVLKDDFDAHVKDDERHVKSGERDAWNAKASYPSGGVKGQVLTRGDNESVEWSDVTVTDLKGMVKSVNGKSPLEGNVTLTVSDIDSGIAMKTDISSHDSSSTAHQKQFDAKQDKIDERHKLSHTLVDGLVNANNAKVTVTQGGTEKGSFTLNQTDDMTIELDAGGTGGVEQVQADWSVIDSSSKAFIKNKPTLASVATTGSYKDLKDHSELALKTDLDAKLNSPQGNGVAGQVLKSNGDGTTSWSDGGTGAVSDMHGIAVEVLRELPSWSEQDDGRVFQWHGTGDPNLVPGNIYRVEKKTKTVSTPNRNVIVVDAETSDPMKKYIVGEYTLDEEKSKYQGSKKALFFYENGRYFFIGDQVSIEIKTDGKGTSNPIDVEHANRYNQGFNNGNPSGKEWTFSYSNPMTTETVTAYELVLFNPASSGGASGTQVSHLQLVKASNALHLEVKVAGSDGAFANAASLVNTADGTGIGKLRAYSETGEGGVWDKVTANGLSESYNGNPVSIDMTGVEVPSIVYYCWISAEGMRSPWHSTVFPSSGESRLPFDPNDGSGTSPGIPGSMVSIPVSDYDASSRTILLSGMEVPVVGLKSPSGRYHAIEKDDCVISGGNTRVAMDRYLQYENTNEFAEGWIAYVLRSSVSSGGGTPSGGENVAVDGTTIVRGENNALSVGEIAQSQVTGLSEALTRTVPEGGTGGQVLMKSEGDGYEWSDPAGGGSSIARGDVIEVLRTELVFSAGDNGRVFQWAGDSAGSYLKGHFYEVDSSGLAVDCTPRMFRAVEPVTSSEASLTIRPFCSYDWNVSSESSLSAEGWSITGEESCSLRITISGEGRVKPMGTGIAFVQPLVKGKTNFCKAYGFKGKIRIHVVDSYVD